LCKKLLRYTYLYCAWGVLGELVVLFPVLWVQVAEDIAYSRPSDPRSTVNPVNVANTCARCHADASYMKEYSILTDQFAKYSTSVHHQALTVRGDLSAPTCTTCHGNHGAAPPGVDRVENVCSNCHTFQAQMYEKSSHKEAF
jgi:cytochrome c553